VNTIAIMPELLKSVLTFAEFVSWDPISEKVIDPPAPVDPEGLIVTMEAPAGQTLIPKNNDRQTIMRRIFNRLLLLSDGLENVQFFNLRDGAPPPSPVHLAGKS
jgi:hypothetical protein